MPRNIQWKPASLIVVGSVLALIGTLVSSQVSTAIGLIGLLLCLSSLIFLVGSAENVSNGQATSESDQQRLDFEGWQQDRVAELKVEAERLHDKASRLTRQAATFQEFMEYPANESSQPDTIDAEIRLSEQDHEVHRILEAEAERVYEAIRKNDYSVDGKIDGDRIRDDAFDLIQKVARIYSPDSDNPLLETSFEQVARAASRVCLHTLVLLEQLPLDVKKYNINEMYGYIRKAVQGYGTYKQVAPWIKRLTRGAYVGRFAAGANPVTLGAWWLATEVTRRGAQKFVEQAVDRQAVAVLHDVVTILGVEVANIYGPGFRQRDPAWIYGTELTEMMHRFPMSRESLSRGLQEITKLPLRSEYDRIYLYRCLAQKRAAGSRAADPTILTRVERETIAKQLEAFFTQSLHGINDKEKTDWQADIESRLDLKLQLTETTEVRPHHVAAVDAVCSVHAFLVSIVDLPSASAIKLLESTDLMLQVKLEDRVALLTELATVGPDNRFEPPDLDPGSEQTHNFLAGLYECTVRSGKCGSEIEKLLLETGSYFRRSQEESLQLLDATFRQQLKKRTAPDSPSAKLSPQMVRSLLDQVSEQETLAAVYDDVSLKNGDKLTAADQMRMGVIALNDGHVRAVLLSGEDTIAVVWQSNLAVTTFRRKGYLIDDCEIGGGTWHASASDGIVVAGSMTGGGYQKMFSFAGAAEDQWR